MDIWKRFEVDLFLLKEFKHWKVVLRKKQITLGSFLFLLNRKIESISELNNEELIELKIIIAWYERKIKNLYKERGE